MKVVLEPLKFSVPASFINMAPVVQQSYISHHFRRKCIETAESLPPHIEADVVLTHEQKHALLGLLGVVMETAIDFGDRKFIIDTVCPYSVEWSSSAGFYEVHRRDGDDWKLIATYGPDGILPLCDPNPSKEELLRISREKVVKTLDEYRKPDGSPLSEAEKSRSLARHSQASEDTISNALDVDGD